MVPPFVGVAVKFTAVFAQTVVASATMDTDGVTAVDTIIVIALLNTVDAEAQVALPIICRVITSPLTNALLEYVAEVAPEIFTPFYLF